MDGYALTAAIRSAEGAGPRIPIVALTANALKNEASRCKDAGMDDYLTKPAKLVTLEATFNRLLPRDASGAEATPAELPPDKAEPVNTEVLVGQFGERGELLGEIFLEFAQASRAASNSLRDALRSGDWDAVVALAHRTKDSARSVGASRLADLCAELEAGAYDRDQRSLSGVGRVFEQEVRSVCDWIETRYGEPARRA
jgi:CheY-like chemotaxis protein